MTQDVFSGSPSRGGRLVALVGLAGAFISGCSHRDQGECQPCQNDEDCQEGLLGCVEEVCVSGRQGTPCDGSDEDSCREGRWRCDAGSPVCSDHTGNTSERCNGFDDDCDGIIPDGENDRDHDGYWRCAGDCDDHDPDVHPYADDLCNEVDDDCDPGTADGEHEDWYGEPCDGADSDDCMEGELVCRDGSRVCSDETGDSIEVCNGRDDDCDGEADEGFECAAGAEEPCSTTCGAPGTLVCGSDCEWPAVCATRPEICGNRIDDDCDGFTDPPVAEVLGDRVRISDEDTESSLDPSLAWNGSGYGVAWQGAKNGRRDIYFTRLDSEGERIGDDEAITDGRGTSFSLPSLVWTGSGYGVAWGCSLIGARSVPYFAGLSPDGMTIGDPTQVGGGGFRSISLVWTGSEYGVAFDLTDDEVYFTRLTEDGAPVGDTVRLTSSPGWSWYPSLVWNGRGYGVAWEDNRDGRWQVFFARLDLEGEKIGDDAVVAFESLETRMPSLVWTGSGYGMAVIGAGDWIPQVIFARLTAEGEMMGAEVQVTEVGDDCAWPDLVWTGSEYGLVWEQDHIGYPDIYFTRLDEGGEVLDCAVRVTLDPRASTKASLVWTGREYGVAWTESSLGRRSFITYFARLAPVD